MACRLFRKAVQQGRSERRGDAYSVPYAEPLSDARTPLADFVNSLLDMLLEAGNNGEVSTLSAAHVPAVTGTCTHHSTGIADGKFRRDTGSCICKTSAMQHDFVLALTHGSAQMLSTMVKQSHEICGHSQISGRHARSQPSLLE